MSDHLSPRARRRNARDLRRRMEELDRLDATYGLGALPRPGVRRRTGSRVPVVVATAMLVLVVALVDTPPGRRAS